MYFCRFFFSCLKFICKNSLGHQLSTLFVLREVVAQFIYCHTRRQLYYGAFTESWAPFGAWLEMQLKPEMSQSILRLGLGLQFAEPLAWCPYNPSHKAASQAWGGQWKQVGRVCSWNFGILGFISWGIMQAWPSTHGLDIVGIFSRPFLLLLTKHKVLRNSRSTPFKDSKLCD